MIEKKIEKQTKKFIRYVPKLTPVEFIGICHLFGVRILDEQAKPRDFGDMLEDCIDKFILLNKKRRKEILTLMEYAAKEKEVTTNGTST